MPNILALDTSTDACSVALRYQGQDYPLFELAARNHTKRLLPMVDDVLQQAGCTLADLDALAYGRGPGSFTGLRICLGVVQGLALGTGLPVLPVSTLQAMALDFYQRHPAQQALPLLVALDARMHEVYWGLFAYGAEPSHPLQPLHPEAVMSPAAVLACAPVKALGQSLSAAGPGWHYPELVALQPAFLDQTIYPRASTMLDLAQADFVRGELRDVLAVEPVYLRDEVTWQKRQRIRPAGDAGAGSDLA